MEKQTADYISLVGEYYFNSVTKHRTNLYDTQVTKEHDTSSNDMAYDCIDSN